MNKLQNPELTGNAQALRRNMTKEERRLWYDFIKKLPVKFNRQKVIRNYIVDFYCAERKLVIELDGSQHYTEEAQKKDQKRDADLKKEGLTVLRYSNYDMNHNFAGVCSDIARRLHLTEFWEGTENKPSP